MAPALRSSQNALATTRTPGAGNGADVLEPVQELFPFCGSGNTDDLTNPGEWPFDRQCILRLPEDLGGRLGECLRGHEEGRADAPEPELALRPLASRQQARPAGRHWEVRAFGEALGGTLVDLPCHVESHLLARPQGPAAEQGAGGTAYKAADISQMLIVHRGPEPPGAAECLDRRTYEWASGLTPPTRRIRRRKFRGRPPPQSEFAPERIAEAVTAIRERMNNEPYIYEELSEVDESFYFEVLKTQPENVWRPPPQRASEAPAAAHGRAGSSAAGAGGGAPAGAAQPGPRKALSSVLSTSSGGSNPGSTAAARVAKRTAGSVASEGAASGSAAAAEGELERRPSRRLTVTGCRR